jgi:glucose-1-phosphate adenylyltransferase
VSTVPDTTRVRMSAPSRDRDRGALPDVVSGVCAATMTLPRVLVLVLAGGAGGRLELLTEQRAKPAVPFAGVYRLIDFPLSNCQHSHIADVWVSVQFHPTSLSRHLANGRPWDLDRTAGGLMTLPPHQGTDRGGWHTGTADSLWRQAPLIREFGPDALVVVSADAVYKLDYREVVDAHLGSGAEVTMVTPPTTRRATASSGSATTAGSPTTPTSPTSRRPPPRPTRCSSSPRSRRSTGWRR